MNEADARTARARPALLVNDAIAGAAQPFEPVVDVVNPGTSCRPGPRCARKRARAPWSWRVFFRRVARRANRVVGVQGLDHFQFAVSGRDKDVVDGSDELGRAGVDDGLGLALGLVDEMFGRGLQLRIELLAIERAAQLGAIGVDDARIVGADDPQVIDLVDEIPLSFGSF